MEGVVMGWVVLSDISPTPLAWFGDHTDADRFAAKETEEGMHRASVVPCALHGRLIWNGGDWPRNTLERELQRLAEIMVTRG